MLLRLALVGVFPAAIVLGAGLLIDDALGDATVRNTIRLSLALYAVAVLQMLFLAPKDWDASTPYGRGARALWLMALAWYAVHVTLALKVAHNWSHSHAVEHTRQRSGWGEGIYVSHLFSLLWTLDVAWWWLAPVSYARRTPWLDRALHAFMAFIIFCGTVVYEQGLIRWAGLVMFTLLAGALAHRLWVRRFATASDTIPT